jgi:tRNA pseudouridine55 synthase
MEPRQSSRACSTRYNAAMFALDKPVGPTAAQSLVALRESDPSLRGVKLGHAGRLDPMAEGLLTVLVGDENRDVHALRGQPKTYEVDVLLGLASDSFDALGIVSTPLDTSLDAPSVALACSRFGGDYLQRYPPFSQARVGGVSLIASSRAGVAVERPVASRTLHNLGLLGVSSLDLASACERALPRIARVRGDFRQEAISARWRELAAERPDARLTVASLRVRCSAGTYMRSLADDLGAALGVPAMAWRIRRTEAGGLTLDGARTLPAT